MNRKLIYRAGFKSWIAPGMVSLVAGAALLVGCGSGDSNGGGGILGSGNNGVEQTFGPLATRVVGNPRPVVLSSGAGARSAGVAGASFSSLVVQLHTLIAYQVQDSSGTFDYFTVPASGGIQNQVTNGKFGIYSSWSPDGTRIAYAPINGSGMGQLLTNSPDGGSLTQITTAPGFRSYPSWSPDGKQIVYRADLGTGKLRIYTIPATGGKETQITTEEGHSDVFEPSWSPDGQRIAYPAIDSAGITQIVTVPSGGGTPTPITTGGIAKREPSWSPDSARITYSSGGQIFTVSASGGTPTQITTGNPTANRPSWSSDGKMIAYSAQTISDPAFQIFTVPAGGGTPTPITTGAIWKRVPTWPAFLIGPVTLIGSGGLLGTDAAGFLYTQSGDNIQSVLTFDTTTATTESRASASVATLTPSNTENPFLVFTITTNDGLSRVAYVAFDIVSGKPGPVSVPSLPAGTTSALVLFNASTGLVSMVAPYTPSRSAGSVGGSSSSSPKVIRQGSTLVLQGRFLAVFDGAGKNQTANGANEVRLDTGTGNLLSFK